MGGDLAETTENNLATNLEAFGVKTTIISPGKSKNKNFNHIEINRFGITGLETLSAARNIRKLLKENSNLVSDADLVLVDWRYVRPLRRQLRALPTRWAIIDRGPPASSGIRGGRIQRELIRNLQKRFWNGAWRIAGDSSCGGFVVSSEHRKLALSKSGKNLDLRVLPSGTVPNHFLREKSDPSTHLYLSYVGRIDKKRGLSEVIGLSHALEDKGVRHSIAIVGEGDMANEFGTISMDNGNISFLGKIDQDEIMEILAKQHVGIMPMPNIAVWRISSPIKLAEYAASGLAIVGPSHPGNQFGDLGRWNLLSKGEGWAQTCANKLVDSIEEGRWEENIVEGALQASRDYHWDVIAKRMIQDIEEIIQYS